MAYKTVAPSSSDTICLFLDPAHLWWSTSDTELKSRLMLSKKWSSRNNWLFDAALHGWSWIFLEVSKEEKGFNDMTAILIN